MTKSEYLLKSVKPCVTLQKKNFPRLPTPQKVLKVLRPLRITPLCCLLCLMIFVIALAFLSCSPRVTGVLNTTKKSADLPLPPISRALPWTSRVQTLPTAFSIYVLPSLLDSLESVSEKRISTLTLTNQNLQD